MTFLTFVKAIFHQRQLSIISIGCLYLFAGLLELVSLAALLPVILNLLDSTGDPGFAGQLLAAIGVAGDLDLKMALLFVLTLMIVRGFFLFLADFLFARMACNMERTIRHDLFSNLLHTEWSYLLTFEKGNIPNIILRETNAYAQAILKLGQFTAGILIAGILILSSVFVSWQAFLIFAIAIIPYLLVTIRANRGIKENAKKRIDEANKIGAYIGESAIHLKYVKASGIESSIETKFVKAVTAYANYFIRIVLYKAFIKHFPEVFGIAILGFLVMFTRNYIGENPTDIVFFLLLLFRGYRQLANVQSSYSTLLEFVPSFEACRQILKQTKPHLESFEGKALEGKLASLSLKNISYAYPNGSGNAVKDLSLELPETGITALAGGSGAGKTTLGDILLGLLKPQSGEIIVNGTDKLDNFNFQLWRQNVGYVPQDVFLITGTIRDNILLGADDKSDHNLHLAAEAAHISDFIKSLPNEYNTEVSDLGIQFSGGQKQRIALARALAKKPKLLILDEATSALDNLTERAIQAAISDISRSIPVVVIAHRLSTIKDADNIYMMEKGKIKESGTYHDLISKKGAFWALNQAAGEIAS